MAVQQVRRSYESQTQAVAAIGSTGTMPFTIPSGYSRVAGLFFPPMFNFLVTLISQRAKENLLTGFSTLVGNYGWIPLYNKELDNDILNLSWTYTGGEPVLLTLPNTITFTLAYE